MNKSNRDGIKYNDIVTIDYLGRIKNGDIVLSSDHEGPLTFKVEHFTLISGFNNAILGMKVGESKKCIFSPKEFFGPIDESLICIIPLTDLPSNIHVGKNISDKSKMTYFTVLNIDKENCEVVIDANHILAGQELSFVITVLSIKYPSSAFAESLTKFNTSSSKHHRKDIRS